LICEVKWVEWSYRVGVWGSNGLIPWLLAGEGEFYWGVKGPK